MTLSDLETRTLPYDLFDCMQVNLAVLAERWHGAGAHLALGATLRFAPVPGPDGLPTVERTVEDHLAEARERLGLLPREALRERTAVEIRPGEGCYVVADAYDLPWLPYHRQHHMAHSFLIESTEAGFVVVDGYHNETQWGSARPGRWSLDPDLLSSAIPGTAQVVELTAAPEGPAPTTARVDLAEPGVVDGYVDAYAQHSDRLAALHRLTLETWFLARSRKLHTAFLAHTGVAYDIDAVESHLRAWDSLTEQVYLAYRRVQRGRAEPQGLLGRLAANLQADRDVFGASSGGGELRTRVAAVVADVLGTDAGALLDGLPLPEAPGFSSFRIAEIVERLESELGIEFDPDDLVPENLHQVEALCGAVKRSLPHDLRPTHEDAT